MSELGILLGFQNYIILSIKGNANNYFMIMSISTVFSVVTMLSSDKTSAESVVNVLGILVLLMQQFCTHTDRHHILSVK